MIRLYYYTKLEYALAAIKNKRLKIALYSALNDPFDFVGIAYSNSNQKKQIEELQKKLSSLSGIICLSQTWKEPLMWGHYADSHKGVCLGFEIQPGQYKPIKYVSQRPTLASFGKRSIAKLSEQDREIIAFNKFEQWSYEKEWRRIVPLEESDLVDGNYYLPFDENMVLKSVLFGARAEISDHKINQIIASTDDVKIAFTAPASTEFDIVIDQAKTKARVPENNRVLNIHVPPTAKFSEVLGKLLVDFITARPLLHDGIRKFGETYFSMSNQPAEVEHLSQEPQKITKI
ncbi:DUF2971 domain-containing protein [Agrobacterium rubi]|uniref:DUF2971 domain-containing protein n=1 Tax=Agrobacterium rubi TaxID=28099 RepID=UPI0015732A5E|nr:DUF2971 domain-containing protein [Agrobacterium rubi]NTF06844.1 DUF2971 domain-containing protein [Agrobacterium rubi]NTF19086.1 DUF2971 domain-containing protein [Agrobacterium rubi]NTF26049.1 DUF2971 domain-containing protein [Agrobacterium rubi]